MYILAYESDKLVGIGIETVTKGINTVSFTAKVISAPDTVKVISLNNGLVPVSEIKTEKITSSDVDFSGLVDFTVEVEEGRDIVVLQLTDPQIIDAAQQRSSDRLGGLEAFYQTDMMEDRCFGYMRETIEATNPDFIMITGDLIYGEFDDTGTSMLALIEFMEGFGIPWAPVFGNHDNESAKGADWQCEQLENAKHCLFKQRALTGNGNYSVGIVQGNELKRVFFMLDSNSCVGMSSATSANGHSTGSTGFGADQIEWFESAGAAIKEVYPDVKFSFAFHIQISAFASAYSKYGYGTISTPINVDMADNKADGDFGYIGRNLKSAWDGGFIVYNKIKNLGADSIFVGHEHCNGVSVVYDGIRFQYGLKSSTYDRANYVKADASIVGTYDIREGTPIVGGTVMTLSEETGAIEDAYHYYCEDVILDALPNAEITGTDLLTLTKKTDTTVMLYKSKVNRENAYKVTAKSQGKVYLDTDFLKNKQTFSFSVYLPETSANKLTGMGEFAIRVKGASGPLVNAGYIPYNSESENEDLKLVPGEWKTYTVDISDYGSSCTEFAFVMATGNVVYFKDFLIDGKVFSTDVPGLQYGTDLRAGSGISAGKTQLNGEYVYEVIATGQGKFYVNAPLVANKSTFSFSVYLPETSANKLTGMGEFAMRVKGASGPLVSSGYIPYNSASTNEELKLVPGEWKTFTVDISGYGSSCTEFAFVIAGGNTIYLKDVAVSDINVSGMQYGTDFTAGESGVSVSKTKMDGEYAYAVVSSDVGKLYINPELVADKDKFSFSVYLPPESTSKYMGRGEFVIRVKPSTLTGSGYISYSSSSTNEGLKLVPGEWKTYTVDISGYEKSCTEFSFIIATGNTVYFKDITVE